MNFGLSHIVHCNKSSALCYFLVNNGEVSGIFNENWSGMMLAISSLEQASRNSDKILEKRLLGPVKINGNGRHPIKTIERTSIIP